MTIEWAFSLGFVAGALAVLLPSLVTIWLQGRK